MASSQVEIASSSPFRCVLKDHNRRERCSRETNTRASAASTKAAFQKNLKELVRDHLHTCISVSSDENTRNNNNNNNNNNANNHHHRRHLKCLTNHHEDISNNVDGSSTISCKQERILDRWAAKQAQEMVSTIERQSQEAEFLITSQKTSSSATEISHTSPNFVAQPQTSSGSSNLGASSLVQIWEARSRPEPKMDRSNSMKNSQNPAPGASRTSSGSSFFEVVLSSVEEQPRQSDIIDSAENEESLADWESTGQSSRSSVHIRGSDVGENERVRIADIIKRLTSEGNDQEQGNSAAEPSSRRQSYGSDQAELKALSHIINSPKIRGRQALNDLLFIMEHERQRELVSLAERQSVTKFTQRGRIQSMLRLRCLQRGTAIQDQQRLHSTRSTVASDANRSQGGSTILHLRERFNTGVEQATSSQSDSAATLSANDAPAPQIGTDAAAILSASDAAAPQSAIDAAASQSSSDEAATQRSASDESATQSANASANNIARDGNTSTLNHGTEDNHHQDTSTNEEQAAPPDNSFSQTSEIHEEDVHEDSSTSSDVTWEGTSSDGDNFDPGEVLESTQSLNNWDGNEMEDEESFDLRETDYNWFADIARPRSYWENRRQAWYQEMLSTRSENNEIRQLLERRAVSTCLSSDFRERMDRLMVSHVRIQANHEDEGFNERSQGRMGQLLLSFFQRHSSGAAGSSEEEVQEADEEGSGGEEAEEEYVEEGRLLQEVDEEESSPSIHASSQEEVQEADEEGSQGGEEAEEEYVEEGRLLQEVDEEESSPSIHASSLFRSWNYSDHHEVADDSEQLPTAASQPLLPSDASNQDTGHFSAINTTMGMELIYNLRAHMEQLQVEISELRRSMQTCMEVQAKLLNSLKQEVHPVPEAAMNSIDIVTKRRSCCICYEMQVDSFLYRCGHMCTCLKCAHELQWSSGKCPICRAPILDVVRAYMDS